MSFVLFWQTGEYSDHISQPCVIFQDEDAASHICRQLNKLLEEYGLDSRGIGRNRWRSDEESDTNKFVRAVEELYPPIDLDEFIVDYTGASFYLHDVSDWSGPWENVKVFDSE